MLTNLTLDRWLNNLQKAEMWSSLVTRERLLQWSGYALMAMASFSFYYTLTDWTQKLYDLKTCKPFPISNFNNNNNNNNNKSNYNNNNNIEIPSGYYYLAGEISSRNPIYIAIEKRNNNNNNNNNTINHSQKINNNSNTVMMMQAPLYLQTKRKQQQQRPSSIAEEDNPSMPTLNNNSSSNNSKYIIQASYKLVVFQYKTYNLKSEKKGEQEENEKNKNNENSKLKTRVNRSFSHIVKPHIPMSQIEYHPFLYEIHHLSDIDYRSIDISGVDISAFGRLFSMKVLESIASNDKASFKELLDSNKSNDDDHMHVICTLDPPSHSTPTLKNNNSTNNNNNNNKEIVENKEIHAQFKHNLLGVELGEFYTVVGFYDNLKRTLVPMDRKYSFVTKHRFHTFVQNTERWVMFQYFLETTILVIGIALYRISKRVKNT